MEKRRMFQEFLGNWNLCLLDGRQLLNLVIIITKTFVVKRVGDQDLQRRTIIQSGMT